MSQIIEQIREAMKAAMRAKEQERLTTIRMIQAEFKRIEVDERIALDDARVLVVLDKMLKQRRDSISQFEAADRQELADKEVREMATIQAFLPTPLTPAEITALIEAAITETGASSIKDMGAIMALLRPQIQGRADAAEVSKAIKARF